VLEAIGYTPQMARWAVATDTEVGRVLRTVGGVVQVLTEAGPLRAGPGGDLLAAVAADAAASPVPGDWVVVRHWPDHRATVTEVLPRRGVLDASCASGGGSGPVGSHIDVAAIAVRSDPVPGALAGQARWLRDQGVLPAVVQAGDCRITSGLGRDCPDVEVVGVDLWSEAAPRLLELVAASRTLAVLGDRARDRSGLLAGLTGTPVLHVPASTRRRDAGAVLVPLPGGGAVLDPGPAAWRSTRPRLAPGRS